ncbi:MAG TPA: GH92 family glycosyl hydrolase [Streptosporangiaceae bacterium]|nr:GH92 family glycosyl hydrolase [Streptosporangiaceae bacterium]
MSPIASLRRAAVVPLLAGSLAVAPAPGADRAPARASPPDARPVCATNQAGDLVSCPRPLSTRELPAGARDRAKVTVPIRKLAAFVDTRTWTSAGGNTFPGADVPFGMMQWSPDTMPHRSAGGGYTFGDKRITGYSLTHVSGPGCLAAGDIPILPLTGPMPRGDLNALTTAFTNKGEIAQAGYYSARSNLPHTVTSQLTETPHAAIGAFTFPRVKDADFLIKLDDSQRGDFSPQARIVGRREISGSITSGNFCDEGSKDGPQLYTVSFDIIFNRSFRVAAINPQARRALPGSVFVSFDARVRHVIEAKVAISYVSTGNAVLNRQRELPGWDFGYYKGKAQRAWDSLLGEITVSGGSFAQTQEFYSLLYKDLLQPNIISDVNRQYRGSDLLVHRLPAGKTAHSGQGAEYGMFSGWDIYHSLAQLQAMLDPGAASDMAQSLVNEYSQNGILPQWGYLNLDNYVMIGDPSDAVIADYYAFGARHFRASQALADMVHQATMTGPVRPGAEIEARFGYLPQDATYGCCQMRGYVSAQLEYDAADSAISAFAAALGHPNEARKFERAANRWVNLFDASASLLVPRLLKGGFVTGVTPATSKGYTEGDAEEYLWDVPNDYAGLFAKLGGNAVVAPELATYLSKPNRRGPFAFMENEFDLGEQFAPDYAGDPATAQLAVSTIRDNIFPPGPSGLRNNDDLGGESSQFIWEMLGLYPENPGRGNLLFASPGFPSESIHLPSGKTIAITAPGASPTTFYVQSLTINGKADSNLYVPFGLLARGATLAWTLGAAPSAWGSAPADAPPSYRAGD